MPTSDFALIQPSPATLFAPYGCMICTSSTAPLLDFRREFGPHQLRLYLCMIHAKEAAQVCGFIEGDEMDELMNVRKALLAKEQELHDERERLEGITADVRMMLQENERLEAARAQSVQRAEQAEAQLAHVAEATGATLAAIQPAFGGDPEGEAQIVNDKTELVAVPEREENDGEPALD